MLQPAAKKQRKKEKKLVVLVMKGGSTGAGIAADKAVLPVE